MATPCRPAPRLAQVRGKRVEDTDREAPRTAAVKWTRYRQTTFLEHLAFSSNVAASERAANVPAGSAYRFRTRSAEFRRAWEVALKTGYDRLELAVLERAINGALVKRTIDSKGTTTEEYKHDDRVAMTLLNAHRASVAAITAAQNADDTDIREIIDGMARRLGHAE